MAKPLTSWLVPSFSQHHLLLVVSELCLHVSVTKFWHKFASLLQVNTPSNWDKFQNCCTDMYLIRFLPNLAVFCVFLWISRIYLNFAAPPPREISEALSKGLFTWRWGTLDRWGNPLRWAKKITLLYMQSYNPAIPGYTFSRSLNRR